MTMYCQDNVAYRQFVGHTLTAIRHTLTAIRQEIANLDGVDEANIKSGVSILGFEGTYTNEDVGVAVTALDIAEGKVAYVNGKKIVGVAGIKEYALTVDEIGTGTGTGSVEVDGSAYTNPIDFKAGMEIELVATASVGSEFVNWTVGGTEISTDETLNYTMPKKDTTVVANFNLE